MSDEVINDFQYQQAPEKKSKTTLWIILAVALVAILCCCALVAIVLIITGSAGYEYFDFSFVPLLSFA